MSNSELLRELGWPNDLIAECDRASAALANDLPSLATVSDLSGACVSASSAGGIAWCTEPVATDSLVFDVSPVK